MSTTNVNSPNKEAVIKELPTNIKKQNKIIIKKTLGNFLNNANEHDKDIGKKKLIDKFLNSLSEKSYESDKEEDIFHSSTSERDEFFKPFEKNGGEIKDVLPNSSESSRSNTDDLPKAYRNEGCQALSSFSNDSIDSTSIIRYGRVEGVSKSKLKNVSTCEKSLQTDVKGRKENIPVETNYSHFSNETFFSKSKIPLKVSTDDENISPSLIKRIETLKQQMQKTSKSNNPLIKKELHIRSNHIANKTPIINTNRKINEIYPQSNTDNYKNYTAKKVINNQINDSNVDIVRLYNNIKKNQSTMPSIKSNSNEKKKIGAAQTLEGNNIKGSVAIPQSKQKQYVAQIKKKYNEILNRLNTIPMSNHSKEDYKLKMEMEKTLDLMNEYLQRFAKGQLYLDPNAPTNMCFG